MNFFVARLVALAVSVSVNGFADCTLNSDVQALFEAARVSQAPSPLAEVQVTGQPAGGMHVVLRDRQGEALASKTFVQPYTCAERAQVVAVFATTWDTAAGLSSALADVQTEPPPVPEVKAEALPPSPATAEMAQTASPPKSLRAWRLGAGLAGVSGANFSAGGQGLGFALEFEIRPAPRWGLKSCKLS